MFLLTGPPAAGKTSSCLAAFRACLRSNEFRCRLLVPTSTMAEHLRNQLAREGFVFSPRLVSTLGRFVDELAPALTPVSPGTLELIVGQVLASMAQGRYLGVRDLPGFRVALARTIAEFSGAGGDSSHLPLTDPDFAAVYEAVTAELKRRSLYLRSQRMAHAATKIAEIEAPRHVWVTGFSAFTSTELNLLKALGKQSQLTITLPEGAVTDQLAADATQHRTLSAAHAPAPRTLAISNTPDGEANEIARRILAEASAGRPWREMGVIVRDGTIVPVLRAAFSRFGIPARYYFLPPLSADATIRYLLALAGAALSGWDHETSLDALRMHGSPLERVGDKWEYSVRSAMPGRGMETLRMNAPEWTEEFFDELSKLSAWATERHAPRRWAERFASLTALFRTAPITDGVSPDLWRDQAAAIDAFRAATDETAASLAGVQTSCREFLDALQTILRSASIRMIDRRRDVVHVLDAMEARQWRLPVFFVAGLLEGRFPRHHSESPILPDEVRRRLNASGVHLKTAGERQAEEQSLFELALTRATETTLLSYARLNSKGEANLPSFLLEKAKPYAEEAAKAIRPTALRPRAPEPFAIIESADLREALALRHTSLSPSAIELYANCPYSFFATRSLKLRKPPERPFDRLNMRVQGDIAHRALELHFRDGICVGEAFDAAFEEFCCQCRIPAGYRTAAVRLELLYGIEQLAADQRAHMRGSRSLFEEPFRVELGEGTVVNGRIDRLVIDEHDNALIVDYKYRRAYRLKDTHAENQSGERVQTGMYLLGVKSLNLSPIGMAYWGFKKEVTVLGWVILPFYPELKAACSEEQLTEVITAARQTAVQAAGDLRSGRIAPEPVDADRCQWCDFINICRYEMREAKQAAGGADAA